MHEMPAAQAGFRVLVADDDPLVRRLFALLLAHQGLLVEVAADGIEALERVADFAPDVVLTDLDMPRCGGDELCRRLKSSPATRHIAVIVVTGSTCAQGTLCAQGCEAVLTKPVRGQDVIDTVTRVGNRVSSLGGAPFLATA